MFSNLEVRSLVGKIDYL
jgi:hypothetical protein